jgi:hypothetical protein
MYITVTIVVEGTSYDLSVDEKQKPSSVFLALKDRGLVKVKKSPGMYKSMLLGEWVRSDLTLKEQGVKSGDLLSAPVAQERNRNS